jgi:hypothetical protein
MTSDGYLVRFRRPVLGSLNSCRRDDNRAGGDPGRYAQNALTLPTTRTSDTASAPFLSHRRDYTAAQLQLISQVGTNADRTAPVPDASWPKQNVTTESCREGRAHGTTPRPEAMGQLGACCDVGIYSFQRRMRGVNKPSPRLT